MIDETSREIWVGESRFYLGEDDIMYVELAGKHDAEEALAMSDAFYKLLSLAKGKVKIFADNSQDTKPSPEARKIFKEMSEHEKCGRVAVLGLNPVSRVMANFVLGHSKNKDTHIFKSKEEALVWLKERE